MISRLYPTHLHFMIANVSTASSLWYTVACVCVPIQTMHSRESRFETANVFVCVYVSLSCTVYVLTCTVNCIRRIHKPIHNKHFAPIALSARRPASAYVCVCVYINVCVHYNTTCRATHSLTQFGSTVYMLYEHSQTHKKHARTHTQPSAVRTNLYSCTR